MKKTIRILTLTLALLCALVLSVHASYISSATPVSLDEQTACYFTDDGYEKIFSIAISKSGYYNFEIINPVEDETYVTVYDDYGEEVGFGGTDDFSGKLKVGIELKTGTYYAVIHCYEPSYNSYFIVTEHTHNLKEDYRFTGSFYSNGTIFYSCTDCEYEYEENIPQLSASISQKSFVYNGKAQVPTVTVKDYTGKTLKEGVDYKVVRPNSVNVGYYEVEIVTLKTESYDDTKELSYSIEEKPIDSLKITVSKTVVYGNEPEVKIEGLKQGRDFDTIDSYYGVGKKSVYIYGNGNYTSNVTRTFTVIPEAVKGLKKSKVTANSIKLKWNASEYYVVEGYQVYDETAKKVIKTVSNSGATGCTLTKLKAGTVYKLKVRTYASDSNGKKYYGPWTKAITVTTLAKSVTVKSVKSTKAKTINVQWNALSDVNGYEIKYSTSSKFTSKTTKTLKINKKKTSAATISKLKSNKKYYIRVRSYKAVKVNGKSTKVYSAWSKTYNVKVK